MLNQPQVSFITITYNGLKDTEELIQSLIETVHSVTYEIIVVDNASKVNEAEVLQQKYSDIKTIRSEINLGFSGGNNLGIKASTGKYIFLINNDTIIRKDGIKELIKELDSSENVGAVSPRICFNVDEQPIQFAGYTKLTPITLRNRAIGFGETNYTDYNTVIETPYLHGAALLLKRQVIERIGLMPEIFFLYYEELDWCESMTRADYKLLYVPSCTIYHKESQSTGQESPLRTYYLTRNRLLFAWRNTVGLNKFLSIIYQISVANNKSILMNVAKRRFDLIKATLKGTKDFFYLNNKTIRG